MNWIFKNFKTVSKPPRLISFSSTIILWKIKMASRLKEEIVVNKHNENEDLLVFGYSCKLFRDDEKALYIDQGKHLIPWMGDETLKIDRYDARGTLFDLKHMEAPSGGFDRFFGLTDMERQVETMCDEERYRALVTNEEEETLYQEEELKRLHYAIKDKGNSYGQVEYKYNGDASIVEENAENPQVEKLDDGGEDEPFVPSPLLDLPLNMILPETMKHNAIIEKTAMFISNQGPQMEIVLKIKQARNPQFNFLSFDNPLHSYYRHLLMAIKGGRYNPNFESSGKKQEIENDEDDHYLHPSLASSVSKVELAPSIPSINYKPSAHCAYSMLVNKIKDKKSNEQEPHLSSKLKKALERLKDEKDIENESDAERSLFSVSPNSNEMAFPIPPRDMQIIIDKMASYVAKNGRDFEAVVQMKNDPRFDFLNSAHAYNPYYRYKIRQYEIVEKSSKPETKAKSEHSSFKLKDEQSKSKLAPVSFSIKKPKETEPVIEKSALPVEESSDEEEKEEKEKEASELKEKDGKEEVLTIDLAAMEEKEERNKKILAAERLKDKLTVAAREKVAMATKEKQLQLDRKRRAAAFLRTIHSDGKGFLMYGPQLPEGMEKDAEGESDFINLTDALGDSGQDKDEKSKRTDYSKHKPVRLYDEKRHRSSNIHIRQKHREKHRSKLEKSEKSLPDDEKKVKNINERIIESSQSSDEDLRKKELYMDKTKKSEENFWKNKSGGSRGFRDDEKRNKKKKLKKDDILDRSSRKRSKIKKEKRCRKNEDSKIIKNKKSRRDSTSSSDQNS